MTKKKKWKKNVLQYGTIRYIGGSKSKVEVIGDYKLENPLCKFLKCAPHSKYKIGDIINLPRTVLFPRQGR